MGYIATDDDLPGIFWPGGTLPEPRPYDATLAQAVALDLQYPVAREKRRQAREERALAKDRRPERKIHVRLTRKKQMAVWLRALENTFRGMDYGERGFCEQLVEKFSKYGPERAYVSLGQYEWLKRIAARYLL